MMVYTLKCLITDDVVGVYSTHAKALDAQRDFIAKVNRQDEDASYTVLDMDIQDYELDALSD